MCSEPDNDRKPNKAVLWTQQNKPSKGKHMSHAKERTMLMYAKCHPSYLQRSLSARGEPETPTSASPDRMHGVYLHGTKLLIPHFLPVRPLPVKLQIQTTAIKTLFNIIAVQH